MLCELCFKAGKLVIWILQIMVFVGRELMHEEIALVVSHH